MRKRIETKSGPRARRRSRLARVGSAAVVLMLAVAGTFLQPAASVDSGPEAGVAVERVSEVSSISSQGNTR